MAKLAGGALLTLRMEVGPTFAVTYNPSPGAEEECHYEGSSPSKARETALSLVRASEQWASRDDT